MSYLQYKAAEENLNKRYDGTVSVCVEPINIADIYYTDGDASASVCKLVFPAGKTIYVPQLIYNVDKAEKKIISEWIKYVKHSVGSYKDLTL